MGGSFIHAIGGRGSDCCWFDLLLFSFKRKELLEDLTYCSRLQLLHLCGEQSSFSGCRGGKGEFTYLFVSRCESFWDCRGMRTGVVDTVETPGRLPHTSN